MRKKSIAKNYLYNMTFQILTVTLPLITAPYVARVIGAEGIGIYSYTLSIVTYFVIVGSLGVALYGQREIAYVQEDKYKRTKTFWEINIMRFITILIAGILYYIFIIRGKEYQLYYKILVLEILAAAFDISWFFKGLEDFKKTVTRNIVIRLLSVTCVFIFVKNPSDLPKYVLIYSLGNMLGSLSLWFYMPKYLEGVKLKNLDVYRHFIPVLLLFIPQISNQVSNIMDKTMLGKMIVDKVESGYYENSQKIIRILISVTTSLGVVMMPRIANTFALGDNKKVSSYMRKSLNFIFFLGFPMMMGIISVSDAFVPIFYGQGFDKVSLLMKVMSPTILLMGVSNVIGTQYLIPTKRQRIYTSSVLIGLVVNFLLNLILIFKFKSVGACISTIVCETLVLGIQLYYLRNELHVAEIFQQSRRYALSSLVMYAACYFVRRVIAYGIVSILLQVMVGVVVYMAMLIIIIRINKKKKHTLSEE
jgi:O-antigen/teichoic acid export membrane protein